VELRQIEPTLKLKMERLQSDAATASPSRPIIQNTLASRTLIALPGEVFVWRRRVSLPGRQAPATRKRQVTLWNYLSFRRESVADEPSLRTFFRARFRAKALFTRRFSPGFR
jgi:hypothetical protein